MKADHRICFIGDSFVHGTADETGLGWVGRVSIAARQSGHAVTAYNLGVRRNTSTDIRKRWSPECETRFGTDFDCRIVFSFGANDMTLENGVLRVTETESTENFHDILSSAKARRTVLAIGPLPVNDRSQDQRIAALCGRYAQIAAATGIPYLALAEELIANRQWQRAVAQGDGTHPDSSGYSLIADRVLQWPAWWFSAPSSPE